MNKIKNWLNDELSNLENDFEFKVEEFKMKLTEDILKVMAENNISRSELATRMGCSLPYISKLLFGEQNLTVENLMKISQSLETTLFIEFLLIRKRPLLFFSENQSSQNYWPNSPAEINSSEEITLFSGIA